MLNEEFFHSELGYCVIHLSCLGEEITFGKIRELWVNKASLNHTQVNFLLTELAKLEIKTNKKKVDNIITFRRPDVR
ncbi:hypothetical protein [Rosenbergiella metrosideri]|uniref:hypothetical protein n=1 Tax=Rosenbergiella metrosideri TaxID=2921185 RepID=UPI001F4FEA25|nr:hypothetical protein [Rosenbergiella metrosideri]